MPKRYRIRWEYEDQLLNARTNLFLVLNGLGAVAVQLATKSEAKIIIAIIVLVANVLWFICAIQSLRVIVALAKKYRTSAPDDPVEELVQNTLGNQYWLRPTIILSGYMPFIVMIGWAIGLYMLLK